MGGFQGVEKAVPGAARKFFQGFKIGGVKIQPDPTVEEITKRGDEAFFPTPEVVQPPTPAPPPPLPEEPGDEANVRARRRLARGRRGTFLTGDLVPSQGTGVGRLGG